MSKAINHSVLAWVLIMTQLVVGVLGHGRVVVCIENDGSSHIELVGEVSSSSTEDDHCGVSVGGLADGVSSVCSEMPCDDELLELAYTLSNTRRSGHLAPTALMSSPMAVHTDEVLTFATNDAVTVRTSLEDAFLFKEQRCSLRATVLNL